MTLALWCVLVAGLLPYVWTVYAKRSKPGYSNANPREFLASLEGRGQRANYAQINAFEAFPFFAAAVVIAQMVGNIAASTLDALAVCFVVARIAHGAAYIANMPLLRSLAWSVGIGSVIAIFVMSA
ncbi:MAG: MAPEG family protein [Gammaproteobacteria bacterium]|nr:MAPEG family protein [Gammaproteobacteria bacterium]